MHFIVGVYDKNKLVLEDAITIDEDNNFEDLLFETIGYSTEKMAIAKFYNPLTKNWTNVRNFSTKLSLCETFNPCQVQFILVDFESVLPATKKKSIEPLKIIMESSKKLKLPSKHSIISKKDKLYNDLINVLEQLSLGWINGSHESIGNNFINRLTDLLWYIDPHHEKLKIC
jgi:hypothetical protein